MAQVLQKIFDQRLHGSKWVEGLPPPGQNAFRFAAANLQFSAPVANQNLPAPVRNLPTEIRVRAVKKKEAGHYSGLSMRTKRSKSTFAVARLRTFVGCCAADLRLASHTEHRVSASQRRREDTSGRVPCQSPVLVTRKPLKTKGNH
jgi:hypothetical protein